MLQEVLVGEETSGVTRSVSGGGETGRVCSRKAAV